MQGILEIFNNKFTETKLYGMFLLKKLIVAIGNGIFCRVSAKVVLGTHLAGNGIFCTFFELPQNAKKLSKKIMHWLTSDRTQAPS
jgi:hypothetical protein